MKGKWIVVAIAIVLIALSIILIAIVDMTIGPYLPPVGVRRSLNPPPV